MLSLRRGARLVGNSSPGLGVFAAAGGQVQNLQEAVLNRLQQARLHRGDRLDQLT